MTPPPYLVQFLRPDSRRRLEFIGSGFVVAPGWALTCWHVVHPVDGSSSATKLRPASGGEPVGLDEPIRIVSLRGEPLDLALLPLPPGFAGNNGPAPIAVGLARDFRRGLEGVDCRAWDGRCRSVTVRSVIAETFETDATLSAFQLLGGIEEGFSGGPVAIRQGSEWVAVGVAYYGGSRSVHSRIFTLDDIVRFLSLEHPEIHAGLDLRGTDELSAALRPPRTFRPVADGRMMLPENYVRREDLFRQVKEVSLREGGPRTVGLAAALRGPGGFGKTTLAKDLVQDPEVLDRFPGIAWVDVGERPDLARCLTGLHVSVTGASPASTEVKEIQQKLAAAYAAFGRPTLIVLDDVWTVLSRDTLKLDAPNVTYFITTREQAVLAGVGDSRVYEIDVADVADCESMFIRRLPTEVQSEDHQRKHPAAWAAFRAALRGLVERRLGRWPLLINLAVGQIRGEIDPEEPRSLLTAIASIEQGLDELGLTAFDAYTDKAREQSADLTIRASLSALARARGGLDEKYQRLAVFPAGQWVPATTLARLWGCGDYEAGQRIARELGDRSLLYRRPDGSVQLHDVFSSYLSREVGGQATMHARLVDSVGELSEPPGYPDAYMWRNIGYHLAGAGRLGEFGSLLRRYRWLKAKLAATDLLALQADFARFADRTAYPDAAWRDVRLIGRALSQSAEVLAREPGQLTSQLYGRLLSIEENGIVALRQQIRTDAGKPWLRPLVPCLTQADSPLVQTWELGRVVGCLAIVAGDALVVLRVGTILQIDLAGAKAPQEMGGDHWGAQTLALSGDGMRAVSQSSDGTVLLWELAGSAEKVTPRTFGQHRDVWSIALNGDGTRAISWSKGGAFHLWELGDGAERVTRRQIGQDDGVWSIALSGDGTRAVSVSPVGGVYVWEIGARTEEVSKRAIDIKLCVWSIALSGDGTRAVLVSPVGDVYAWELDARAEEVWTRWIGRQERWSSVALSGDGTRAMSWSPEGTLRLWELGDGAENLPHRRIVRQPAMVRAIALNGDGTRAISGSYDDTVLLWELADGAEKVTQRTIGQHIDVRSIALSADGTRAVSTSGSGEIHLWELGDRVAKVTMRPSAQRPDVISIGLNGDGTRAVSGSFGGDVHLWELGAAAKQVRTRRIGRHAGHHINDWFVALSTDGTRAVSGSYDNTVLLWELADEAAEVIPRPIGRHDGVWSIALSADGTRAVTGSENGTVLLWELGDDGAKVTPQHIGRHNKPVASVALSGDGTSFVSGSKDRTLKVWGISAVPPTGDFEPVAVHDADAMIDSCAVSNRGSRLVVAAVDSSGFVHLLVLESG